MAEPFRVIATEETPPSNEPVNELGIQALMLGLGALSQRTVVGLSKLFTLATVGSVFWLFMVHPEPNTMQLVEMGLYAAFVLVANFIVRN